MSVVPAHAQRLVRDENLVKTLRCVMEQLGHWRCTSASMPEEAWGR